VQDALWDFEPEPGGGKPAPAAARRTSARAEREPHRYQRRGVDSCPQCGQPVEVFAVAPAVGYDAVVPGEYPSARVPEDAARHLVRGRLWPGRDPGGWSRIWHRAVCPEEAMPEDPELFAMWRALRVRRRARAEAKAAGDSSGGARDAKQPGGRAEPDRGSGGR
jgi:hypothetical protein